MVEIKTTLTPQTFKDYDRIEAVFEGKHQPLWARRTLPPLQTESNKAHETKTLSVPISSEADLQLLKKQIEELRPDRHP